MTNEIQNNLSSFQLARLIPTIADSKKEERATSSLLAALMVVPEFSKELLSQAGAPIGKRSEIKCFTEVVFKSTDGKKPRPDGLILVTNGNKKWSALVESKIGSAELSVSQIEEYLDITKTYKIDALITFSNQFAAIPSHHPISINKAKLRTTGLYHFSWLSIKSMAVLIIDNQKIADPEQSYILSELVRYFDHDYSGISSLTTMSKEWKEVCTHVQRQGVLHKNSQEIQGTINSWQQLLKFLSLELSMQIGEPVTQYLGRGRTANPELNFIEDCNELIKDHSLKREFEIPNAAARINFQADFVRRAISYSMVLDSPKDKSRATACINWFTRQLKNIDNQDELTVRVHWPKRYPMTQSSLRVAIDSPESLIPENIKDLPSSIEVVRIIDLLAKFKGAKVFVEESTANFIGFYKNVGQHLIKWQPKAPKVKEKKKEETAVPIIMGDDGADINRTDDGANNKIQEDKSSIFERLIGF